MNVFNWIEFIFSMAGAYFSQVVEKLMKKFFFKILLLILSSVIISCSDNEDSSGTTKELDLVLNQPNSTDERTGINLPRIPSNNCYLIDSSSIDNSTIDNSSVSENSTINDSSLRNCARVSKSRIILSLIDNSTIDNSTIDNNSVVKNGSYVCTNSTIDNSTIDNASVCSNSTVSGGSTVEFSKINDNTTVINGSIVTNGSEVCNSTIDNSTIDNSSVCTGASMSLWGRIIEDSVISDTVIPNITHVSSLLPSQDYSTDDNITIQVYFSEAVTVDNSSGNNPTLQLETGSTDREANYIGGSTTNSLRFLYTIQSGDENCDLDYKNQTSLDRNGATIRDNSSNNAVLTLPTPGTNGSLGSNKEFVVNDSGKC